MNKHTPEPWFTHNIGGLPAGPYTFPLGTDSNIAAANATRIVACVNFCMGEPTETLQERPLREVLAESNRRIAELLAENRGLRKALQAYVTQREKLRGFPQAWEPYSGADVLARSALEQPK